MAVVSNRNGVMSAEERCYARSGYDFVKKYLQEKKQLRDTRAILTMMTSRPSISRYCKSREAKSFVRAHKVHGGCAAVCAICARCSR